MKKSNRIKAAPSTLTSRAEMEHTVGQIAALVSGVQAQEAELNAQITRLRATYEPALQEMRETIEAKTALARDWAEANPAEFGTARSISFPHGTVGWRKGNPALKLLNRKWSWEKVLSAIQSLGHLQFIRTTQEVNKQAILDVRSEFSEQHLQALGLRVEQSDAFYIEPAVQQTPTRVEEP